MSRFYNNCVDEASLTTLCPICLDSFQGAKGVRVRRADPKQKIKDVCTYCQIRYGFDGERRPMNAICDTTAKSETLSVKGCKVKITYASADTDCLDAIQKLLQTTILRTAGHTAA